MFGFKGKIYTKPPAALNGRNMKEYNKQYTEPFGKTGHDGRNNIILSQDVFLSMNNQKTRRNTHVCVIGGAGSGKTHNFIVPNLLQANSNYVISDRGGFLFRDYAKYLEYMGYKVKCLNLLHMDQSNHYNPFRYIRSDKDIETFVNALIDNTTSSEATKGDPFWEKTETTLLTALVAFLHQYTYPYQQNFSIIMRLLRAAQNDDDGTIDGSPLDMIFQEIREIDPESFAVKQYDDFRMGAGKILSKVLFSCMLRLQAFDLWEAAELTATDDIDLEAVGDEKTALFVITPPADTTFNFLADILYAQLFQITYDYCETTAPFTQVVLDREGQVIKTFRADNEYESREMAKEARKWLESAKKADIVYQEDMGWYELIMNNGETAAFHGSEEEAQKALDLLQEGCVVANSERSNSGQRLPIHVRVLLDEFTNIGRIPRFGNIVATSRVYELSTVFTLQSLARFKKIYEHDWPDIIGNCDTIIYLGGNSDIETRKWLADRLVKRMETAPAKKNNAGANVSYDSAYKQIRDLADDTCIVLLRGFSHAEKPKYMTNTHPMWNLAKELGPYAFSKEKRQKFSPEEWGAAEEQPEEEQEHNKASTEE